MNQIKSNTSKPLPDREKSDAGQKPWSKLPSDRRGGEVKPPVKNGFDPYNSGVFDARRTWEKVIRK